MKTEEPGHQIFWNGQSYVGGNAPSGYSLPLKKGDKEEAVKCCDHKVHKSRLQFETTLHC